MTVTELLKRLAGAYSAFDNRVIEAFAPVFRSYLAEHEGERLEKAYTQVLGTWRPKSGQRFPLPADFNEFLKLDIPRSKDETGPIQKALDERHDRAVRLYAAWFDSQGIRIRAARPQSVYGACCLEAYARAKASTQSTERILLSPEDIARCELSAVTSERVHRFGPLPKSADVWQAQCDEIRADWTKARAA